MKGHGFYCHIRTAVTVPWLFISELGVWLWQRTPPAL